VLVLVGHVHRVMVALDVVVLNLLVLTVADTVPVHVQAVAEHVLDVLVKERVKIKGEIFYYEGRN